MSDEQVFLVEGDPEPGRFSAAQELAIAALAAGSSHGEAAEVASVSKRTIVRWMTAPGFREEVDSQKAARVARVSGLLLDAGSEAVVVLRRELDGERAVDRVRAASLLLSHGLRFRQHGEVEDRLREIERRLGLIPEDETGEEA
jgi:hypothetical protein